MATIAKTIKKAEKLTGQKVIVNCNNMHFVTHNGYTISWYPNGRMSPDAEAMCFYTSNKARTEDDMNSDYWPGTFHDNLTQAFKFIARRS